MATLTLAGSVVHQNGNPIPDMRVIVNERKLRGRLKLGETTTQEKGQFSLSIPNINEQTQYYIEVQNAAGKPLVSQGPFPVKISNTKLRLVVPDSVEKGAPVFIARAPVLRPYAEEWQQGGADKPVSIEDARFIATQTGVGLLETWRWMKAQELEVASGSGQKKIPAEALYGLLQQGLPANIAALTAMPTGELKAAWQRAASENHISDGLSPDSLATQWTELMAEKALDEKPQGLDASLGQILAIAGLSAGQQKKLMEVFSTHEGDDEQFWVKAKAGINAAGKVEKARTLIRLLAYTGGQPQLLAALANESFPAGSHPIAVLAAKDAEDWKNYITTASATKPAVPEFIKGATLVERTAIYAAGLADAAEKAFFTTTFFRRLVFKLSNTSGGFGSSRADLLLFYSKNPGFDFKTASAAALTEGAGLDLSGIANRQNLLKELRSVRRMVAITEKTSVLQALRTAGLDSARAVANLPRNEFSRRFASAFGSAEAAEKAHAKAESKSLQASALWAALHPNLNLKTAATNGPKADLRTLFGSLDACDCEHCMSVYSPAAYLTDILHFLESRSNLAYEELVRRRPDLPGLLLNCDNTNTPLPYVDLVIELLENEVAPVGQPPVVYQTTATAAELAANPEHGNPTAYEPLKTGVYPHNLPFHFPLEESRVYLSHLGLPRHRLIGHFFNGKETGMLENTVIALEYLAISPQESNIISGQTTGAGANPGTWNFFGFDKATGFRAIPDPVNSGNTIKEGNWITVLTGRVDVFLQQTGLRYTELLTLLSCDFVNPKTGNGRKISITATAGADANTCRLDLLQLSAPNEDDLVRVHRFLRLWRKLKWSMYDLDKTLKAFGMTGFNANGTPRDRKEYLTSGHMKRLAQVGQLRRRFNCGTDEVLALWWNIGADQYPDFETERPTPIPSLYEKLFRNKAVLQPLSLAFTPDPANLTGSLDAQAATLQAALQISDADYRLLRGNPAVAPNDVLNSQNLSALYRYAALAHWAGLSVADLLTLIPLSGTNPFAHPGETLLFLWKANFIKASGFSLEVLDYLLRDRFTENSGLAPSSVSISVFLDEIKTLVEPMENDIAQKLAQQFSEAFGLSAKTEDLLLLRKGQLSVGELDSLLRDRFIETPDLVPTLADVQSFLDEIKELVETTENTVAQKVAQKFSEASGLSAKAADLLLIQYLKNAADSNKAMVLDFLLPDTADETGALALQALKTLDYRKFGKAAWLVQKFKISDDELEQILKNHVKIGCLDFNALPVGPQTSAGWAGFEALVNLIRARDLTGFGAPGLFGVLQFAFDAGNVPPSKEQWTLNLIRLSNWEIATVEGLIGKFNNPSDTGILKTQFPADYRNGDLILRIKKALDGLRITGLGTAAIADLIKQDVSAPAVQAIKLAVRAKYDEAQWQKIAKPLRDELRERQRSALVEYVVSRPNPDKFKHWNSSEELYEFLLIDVEMKPMSMTSRLKQAICSVQLFIDRALMNLERDTDGEAVLLHPEQAEEWKTWRKIYRVWEANRKIFLYPENWIEPDLRDDQTSFFREATSQLLQNELTPEAVEDAFRVYLEKLDEVARLEIVGLVHQKEPEEDGRQAVDILYVFGRTYSQPHSYFFRTYEKNEWSPWLKIEANIDSDHLVPVIFNRRLCLFWLFFTQESEEGNAIDLNQPMEKTKFYWKIQVAWSEFRKNSWTGKKLSKSYVESEHVDNKSTLEKLRKGIFLRYYFENDRLLVNLTPVFSRGYFFLKGKEKPVCQASFIFENTSGEPQTALDTLPTAYSLLFPENALYENELIQGRSSFSQPLILNYETVNLLGIQTSHAREHILDRTAHPRYSLAVEVGAPQPFARPFVFQDNKHSFFVEPFSVQTPGFGHLLPDLPDLFVMEQSLEQVWRKEIKPTSGSLQRAKINITSPDDEGVGTGITGGTGDSTGTEDETIDVECLPENDVQAPAPDNFTMMMASAYPPASRLSGRVRRAYRFSAFHHPQVKNFMRELNKGGVPGLLRRSVQEAGDLIEFDQAYQPTRAVIGARPEGIVDFAYGGPFAQYNWELFFHLPIHIACRLSADQRFEEARRWFHFVFDPTTGDTGEKERFWQFKPFHDEAKADLENLEEFLKNQEDLAQQVEKWSSNPFQPHVIARMRRVAYMKFVVMKYVDNLIAWGDQLFRRDTIESINEATNLYVLAAKILGPAPQRVPARALRADKTFDEIKDDLDSFSNALVEIEGYLSPSGPAGGTLAPGSTSALGTMLYFGVPRNEYLLRYWETVADRLFKIRHSLNIDGITRTLPLFEPPIDPALLVRAAAGGQDLSSLLNDVNPGLPLYRFAFMLQKANELANEVKGLGASLLSALANRDAEALTLLRSGHEQYLLKAILQVRERQVEEAKENLNSLNALKRVTEERRDYFGSKEYRNASEETYVDLTQTSHAIQALLDSNSALASLVYLIPEIKIGSAFTIGSSYGGVNLGNAAMAALEGGRALAGALRTGGEMANIKAIFQRRDEEWKFQTQMAELDLVQISKQILASEIRLAISERELSNHQLQMEQSAEADEFMRSKFTNRQLFDWMAGQLSTLYFQSYQLAYDLAKRAEKCFQFELPAESIPAGGYVKFGYWDNLKKGLLAGEKLQYDLRRLEMAHIEQNEREFELTKHFSLAQIAPEKLLELKSTGKCDLLSLPEALFDLDFPGHYLRRVKSVSLSIPCIAGPYTSINATLRLTKNRLRITDALGQGYARSGEDDLRFRDNFTVQSIATSSAQNDSGLFELNFRDERYLPFEGAGVDSDWVIEMPRENNQFDFETITDVILHLRYTAKESKDVGFKTAAKEDALNSVLNNTFLLVNLRQEFSTEWYRYLNDETAQTFDVDLKSRLPFIAQGKNIKVKYLAFTGLAASETDAFKLKATPYIPTQVNMEKKEGEYHSAQMPSGIAPKDLEVIKLTITKNTGQRLEPEDLKELFLILKFEMTNS